LSFVRQRDIHRRYLPAARDVRRSADAATRAR
jgi:hypothetical protein